MALMFFTQTNLLACSCPTIGLTIEQKINGQLDSAKAVFSGKVVEIVNKSQNRDLIVKIKVEEFWKGNLPEEIIIETDRSDAACGYPFVSGKSYLIFAYVSDENILTTGLCLPNREISKAEEELKILGKGKEPEKANQ